MDPEWNNLIDKVKAVARKFPREGPNQEKGIASGASENFLRFFFVNVFKIEQKQEKYNGERSEPKIFRKITQNLG